jgi:hypothetical protein
MKMEAVCFSKMVVNTYQTTVHHSQEDLNLRRHHHHEIHIFVFLIDVY